MTAETTALDIKQLSHKSKHWKDGALWAFAPLRHRLRGRPIPTHQPGVNQQFCSSCLTELRTVISPKKNVALPIAFTELVFMGVAALRWTAAALRSVKRWADAHVQKFCWPCLTQWRPALSNNIYNFFKASKKTCLSNYLKLTITKSWTHLCTWRRCWKRREHTIQ